MNGHAKRLESDRFSSFSTDEARWQAVERRDAGADGRFWYSVATTGIYCRPSCGARLPRRENIRFHGSTAEAERAGFRPCKRCRPNDASLAERRAAIIASACRVIEQADAAPSLAVLAKAAGLGRFHFHRNFKACTGLTPKASMRIAAGGRARNCRAAAQSRRRSMDPGSIRAADSTRLHPVSSA